MSALRKAAEAADHQITAIHAAFGAPGDHGYESREGKALFELYKFQVELRAAIRQSLIDDARGDPTRRPQDWIAIALEGFLADEASSLPPEVKGSLVAKMALACTGIQGEVEIAPFERLLTETRP